MDANALGALKRAEIQKLAKANKINATLKSTVIIKRLLRLYPSGVPRTPSRSPDRKERSHNPSPAIPPDAVFTLKTPQPTNGMPYESASGAPRRPIPSPRFTPDSRDSSPLAVPRVAFYAPLAPAPAVAAETRHTPNPEQASAAGPSVAPVAGPGAEPVAGPSGQQAARRIIRVNGPGVDLVRAWLGGKTHAADDEMGGVGVGPEPQPAAAQAQPNGAEAEPARPPSAASSGVYSYRSYQSDPDVDPEPASNAALKRAVRSMRAISEKNGARYAESQVMRKSAERQLREIKALRRQIAAEKAMRIRAVRYLTYWQNKSAYWSEEEMYDGPIRTRQDEDGNILEMASDEESMNYVAPLEQSKGQKGGQRKQTENQPKDQPEGQTEERQAGKGSKKAQKRPRVDPAILQRMANVMNPPAEVNGNGKRSRDREQTGEVEEVRKTKKSRTGKAGQDQAGPSVNGVVKVDKGKGRMMSPVPEDEDEDLKDSESVLLLLGIMLSDDSDMEEEPAAGPQNAGVVANRVLPDELVRPPVFRAPTRAERAAQSVQAPSQRRQSSRLRGAHNNRV